LPLSSRHGIFEGINQSLMNHEHEKHSSGKEIMRLFNDDGSLYQENHSHGMLVIAIQYTFKEGKKIDETYFSKKRMVSRRTYEKVRLAYADMPPADNALEDWGAKLLRGMAKEKQQHRVEAERRIPNRDEAAKSDTFCTEMIKRGTHSEVREWIKSKNHTLGERNWASSKNLVHRLASLGCVNIYACEIDAYEDGIENTGHLVIELPQNNLERKRIFKKIDSLAREQGYSGPFDNGQRYAYMKLD
jgi:hypothetical protein